MFDGFYYGRFGFFIFIVIYIIFRDGIGDLCGSLFCLFDGYFWNIDFLLYFVVGL